jgi:hypothetical protein
MPKSRIARIALGLGLLLLPLIPFAANGQLTTCNNCMASFACDQKDRQCADSCKAYEFGSDSRLACNKSCYPIVKACMDAANERCGYWCGPYHPR